MYDTTDMLVRIGRDVSYKQGKQFSSRDTHVLLSGPCKYGISYSFAEYLTVYQDGYCEYRLCVHDDRIRLFYNMLTRTDNKFSYQF